MNQEAKPVSTKDEKAGRIAQAFTDLQSGQVERARAVFANLMHDPHYGVDAQRGLAAVAWRHQQADAAIQMLKIAIQQQPDHADAQADLALLLFLTGRAAESLVHWDKRLRLCPADALAWHNYGKALASAGRIDVAVSAF
ncbi:MAG: tetratricopeptide repeat protein, partial [Pedosphaera parvula]|nr:tetratricopeptide repeat protein [Pedosphaera parvula]